MQSEAQPCSMHNTILHQQDIHVTNDSDITPLKQSAFNYSYLEKEQQLIHYKLSVMSAF